MYFIRSPQITPTTTLNIVYQSVLIIDRECVLCVVGTEIIYINFNKFQYTTPYHGSGSYSHASQTRGSGVRFRVNPCGIYGGQSATGKGFSTSTTISPSVLFTQCSILFFHLIILLPFGEPGQNLGTFNNAAPLR